MKSLKSRSTKDADDETQAPKVAREMRGTEEGRDKEGATLAELNAWFTANWELVTERAKANTRRLTGKESF